jgi:sugar-phosphatase
LTRALLFDLDGVLIDSAPAYRAAWKEWAEIYQVDEEAIWRDAHGRRPDDIIRRVRPEGKLAEALQSFDRLLGGGAAQGVSPLPGALDLLAHLHVGEWAIVTSGRRRHVQSMLSQAEIPIPSVLVCGDDTAEGKPNPECFLLAAERLQVQSSRCIVVEDAPAGIKAARAAGMTPVAVATTHRPEELVAAERVFASLTNAGGYLLECTRGI